MSPKKPEEMPKRRRVVTVRLTQMEYKRLGNLATELGINETDVLVEGMRMARDFDSAVNNLDSQEKKVLRKLFRSEKYNDEESQNVADKVLAGLIRADVRGVRRRAQLALKLLQKKPARQTPKEGEAERNEAVTVRLTEEEDDALEKLASRLKMTKSDALVEGVRMVEDLCGVVQKLGHEDEAMKRPLTKMVMNMLIPADRRDLAGKVLMGMIEADFMRAGNRANLALRLLEEEDAGSPR